MSDKPIFWNPASSVWTDEPVFSFMVASAQWNNTAYPGNTAFMNSARAGADHTPAFDTNPFAGEITALTYDVNAFSSIHNATNAMPEIKAVRITDGPLGTSRAGGVAVTINNSTGGTLFGNGGTGRAVSGTSVTVNGNQRNKVGRLTGATNLTVEGGSLPNSTLDLTNSGVADISAVNDLSLRVAGTSADINPDTAYVNPAYTATSPPLQYTDPFTGATAELVFGVNAFPNVADALTGLPSATMIYFTGGALGTSYANGVAITVNACTGNANTLYGGQNESAAATADITVKAGMIATLYGGGRNGDVTGDITLTVTGGTIGNIYGGSHRSVAGASAVGGSVNITVGANVIVSGSVYGGGVSHAGHSYVSGVDGDVTIFIAGQVKNNVCAGGYDGGANDGSCSVSGNSHITLSGATITGSVDAGSHVNGAKKTITVTGNKLSTVGGLTGTTNLTIEAGSSLKSIHDLTNSGEMKLSAANDPILTVARTFYNSGSIRVDATGYEMADGVYQVMLIDAATWSGDTTNLVLDNYTGTRSLTLAVNNNDLYLVDIDTSVAYVNSAYSQTKTPATYTNPATGETVRLIYGANAFSSVATAAGRYADVEQIYVTGGRFGTEYANGVAITVNTGTFTVLHGGGTEALTGDSSITVNTGTFTDLYGGGSATLGGNTGITYNGGSVGGIYGGGDNGDVGGNVNITVSGGSVSGIYGGGNNGDVGGNVNITITGGLTSSIYGGSLNGEVGGNVNITVDGGSVNNIYGGGNAGGIAGVDGAVTIRIGKNAVVNNTIQGGGYSAASGTSTVGSVDITVEGTVGDIYGGGYGSSGQYGSFVNGDCNITLSGATAGLVDAGANVLGANKTVTVTGNATTTVRQLTGSTKLTIEKGSSLRSFRELTNSGEMNISAANNLSLTADRTFINSGSIAVDATGYEMADGVSQVKLIDTAGWGGNTTNLVLVNYTGHRNLKLTVSNNDLYLADVSRDAVYVCEDYTASGTPETYTDPYSGNVVDLLFNVNAFSTVADALSGNSGAALIIITGKDIGSSYAGGTAVTVNDADAGGTLFGGCDGASVANTAITVKGTSGAGIAIVGGGNNGDVTGSVGITQTGGTVSNIYGGSFRTAAGSSTVAGPVFIMIGKDATVSGSAYGGGYSSGSGNNSEVSGNVNITIEGSVANVYGGGNSADSTVSGNVGITLSGATVTGTVDAGYAVLGASRTVTVTGGVRSTVGTISGATATVVERGATLLAAAGDWHTAGTLNLYADDDTVITVNGSLINTGTITVDATGYVMGDGIGNVRLIAAAGYSGQGRYIFQNGTRFYDAEDGSRYILVATDTGLWMMTQGTTAYICSHWDTAEGTVVYDGEDGSGTYGVNAFNQIANATDGSFQMIFVEGGDYSGGEFHGVSTVIQSGEEIGAATRFTGNVYGGMGAGSSAWAAATDLTINGGDFGRKHAVGGNQINGAGDQNFTSSLTLNGGTNFNAIIGGNQILVAGTGIAAASELFVDIGSGTASVVIGGNQVDTGSYMPLTVTGDAATIIRSGTFSNFVMGADYVSSGTLIRQGAVSLTITGGTFARNISGGNLAADATASGKTRIIGDTNLTLDATERVITIGANVYGGSYGIGAVEGNANVTIRGLGENLNFTGVLSGDSQGAYYSGTRDSDANFTYYVSKRKTLTFDGFTGDFNAAAVCFQTITVTGDSAVTLTAAKTHLSAASVWSFELGGNLNWEAGTNDFTGDILNFNFESGDWGDLDSWAAVSGSNATFCQGWESAKTVNLAGETALWDSAISGWATREFQLTFADNSLIVGKLAYEFCEIRNLKNATVKSSKECR